MRSKTYDYNKEYTIDTPLNYVLLVGVSLFFWVAGYIASVGYPLHGEMSATPLCNTVCRMLPGKTVTYLTGLLLTIGGAFLIYRANYMLMIIREKTLMPFLLYILLVSSNPDFFPLKSTSPGIFCLIIAFYQLLTSYHQSGAAIQKIFNDSFFIGAGSLLWIHILWFLPVFWLGMYNFKILTPRTFLSSLIGTGVVYWFLLGWCVWQHDYTSFSIPFASLCDIGLPDILHRPFLTDWMQIVFIVFLAMISTINILLHEYEEGLRTRRFLSFLILFAVASSGLFLLYRRSSDEFLGIVCMPVSILVSHFFTVNKGKKKYRLYYLLILLFIFLSFLRSSWTFLSDTVI